MSKSICSTHLKSCHCGHRFMSKAHDVKAAIFTLAGEISITVRTMHCNAYSCRTTFGPNYFAEANKKVNTAAPHHVSEVLSVSPNLGFSAGYLRYTILPWNFVPTRAVQSVCESVFGMRMNEDWFRELHSNAVMYWLALHELYLDLHHGIVIGSELSMESLQAYDEHLHSKVFPPPKSQRAAVQEVVWDGDVKVHVKCGSGATHKGRPRKNGKSKA